MLKVLAIIPARSGSKGIKNKNIKLFKNKPLIYWSIKQALESRYINRVICSTDSPEILKFAKKCGAECPFLRPKNISGDLSTDYEFIEHCLHFLKENEEYVPDIIIQLRPTYPTRKVKIIDNLLSIYIINRGRYDSLRTVINFEKSPYKMYSINNEILNPLFKTCYNNNKLINEPYNKCRQQLPKTFLHNGYVDIMNSRTILKYKSVTGNYIYPYVMDKSEYHDIDTIEDWEKAEKNI